MPNWLIKTAIHRAISFLPNPQRWNEMFQKYGTKSLGLSANNFEVRLGHCRMHLRYFFELRPQCRDSFTVVELGTGWFPTLAIGMHLCGAKEVWTYDIDPLLNRDRLRTVLNFFSSYHQDGRLKNLLPGVRPDRIARLLEVRSEIEQETPQALLAKLNIHVKVQDAQQTGLPNSVADLIFSHGVLEYIPRPVLANIFSEFKRVASPNAVLSHSMDLTDQFHYFDRSISPFNFLKFSEQRWAYLNSPLIWQSRMRISDYRTLLKDAGFELTTELNESKPASTLEKFELAPEFRSYTQEELLVSRTWLVAKPVGS